MIDRAYHRNGARYYACWLGRWTASDPAGLVDGVNLYMYVRGNPVRLNDPSGMESQGKDSVEWVVPKDVQSVDQFKSWATSVGLSYSGEVKIEWTGKGDGRRPIFRVDSYSWNPTSEDSGTDTLSDEEIELGDEDEMEEGSGSGGASVAEESVAQDPDAGTVGAPGFAESLIPIWGSGRDAIYNFQKGNYGWGTFYTVMAISDVFLLKSLVTAGLKAAGKGGAKVLAKETGEVVAKEGAEEVVEKAVVGTGEAATKELAEKAVPKDWGGYLKKLKGAAPAGMLKPHAHHIVFKGAFKKSAEMRRVLAESRAILEKYGIDYLKGADNLVWAPNIAGQHTIKNAKIVLKYLKEADMLGAKEDVLKALEYLGEMFAKGKGLR